ncbi:MAG: LarC family nickel insertion protein, partial [Polyangiaceae bacterium]
MSHDHDHDHGHGHSHSHDHGHHHDHAHPHAHDPTPRQPLERGAGRGKILFFDCFSGVAGDMTIAAMLDLGVPETVIRDAVAKLPVQGYELAIGHVHRSQIVATKFDVAVDQPQPHRTYGAIDDMIAEADFGDGLKARARAIFRRLGEAEAHTHRMPLRDVHFHEVGAVDAIVDVVGAAAALDHLGAEIVVSPLPMGRGFVKAQHGILPLPAPATVTCLRGAPTYEVPL